MFLVGPDKLDIKRLIRGFYLSCIISRSNGEKTAKQIKRDAVLFELANVANAL